MEAESDHIFPANLITFQDFCELCEKLFLNKKNRTLQDTTLTEFINGFKLNAAQFPGHNKNCSFFPVLRFLLPELDRERAAYNLKEHKLGQLYVKILSLHKTSFDAQKLLSFRSVASNQHGSDFAGVAYFVLQSRGTRTGTMSIGDINIHLDKIANAEAGTKAQILDEVFTHVLVNTTPLQQKWWIRIILKDMKLGMGNKRILSCFHPDAPEHYETYQNILKICEELEDGDTRPAELGIELYCAISPMLSERLDVTNIGRLPSDKTYQVETKFDGERFQVHMSEGTFGYYSRRGYSYTSQYGKTYDSDGLLTPLLKDCFDPEVHSFIIDGEMMGWHKERNCFGSKGMAFDVKKISANSKFRPCFCPFDILYYNGRCLAGVGEGALPLSQRLQLLDGLFCDVPGVIMHSARAVVIAREDILTALNKAIDNAEEGIIVKATDSHYVANRRNAGWYKVKPEYTDGVMADLDLMIVGADYAENKQQGLAKSFFLALAVPPETPGEMPQSWVSVGRVATGLSFEERQQLSGRLAMHWKPLDKHPAPAGLHWAKEKPDLWIHPDNSCILQVKASELIRSAHYAAGYTLRFPRITRLRDDKPLKDAMTTEEFQKLVQGSAVEKLTSRNISADELNSEPRVRRKRKAKVVEVAEAFRATQREAPVEPHSTALRGRKLCVLSGDDLSGKDDLEKLIESHGGVAVQHAGSDTWCAVAGKRTQRVQNALESASVDVVLADWLRGLRSGGEGGGPCPPPAPLDMLAVTKRTRRALARDYDAFGDSYTQQVDTRMLKKCFESMDNDCDKIYLASDEMLTLDEEIFGGASPFSFLRTCRVHVPGAPARRALGLRACGAKVCPLDAPDVTHVVVDGDGEDVEERKKLAAPGALFVSASWLEACLEQRCKVDEESYKL